jgi:predicted Zn-dependent peptidase
LDLTQLSYDDIVEHYKKTVTLSNCTFVLHGDMNPQYFTSEFAKNVEEFKPPAAVFHSPPAIAEKVNLPKTINFEHLRQESIMMLSFRIDNATDE